MVVDGCFLGTLLLATLSGVCPTGGTAPVGKEVVGCRPGGLWVRAVRPSLRVAALEFLGGWCRGCAAGGYDCAGRRWGG